MSFMLLGILNSQVSGGGGAAFDLLETQILASSAASVTFTGLDAYSDYKHLQIRGTGRTSGSGTSNYDLRMRFNSDTGSNYAIHNLAGNGSSVSSSGFSSTTYAVSRTALPGDGSSSGVFGAFVIDLLDFSSASKNTTTRSVSGSHTGDTNISLNSSLWNSTSAVTAIELYASSGNLLTGSRFSLYGVR